LKLEARFSKRLGALTLDVAFRPDASLALFGPSGAGKSTALACLAGLVRPDAGRIALDGRVLFDSGRGIDVPAHRRCVAPAFQDHRLFPHRDVRGNLTFAPGADRGGRMARVVDELALEPLLNRMPRDLSGGERARVSLGRALLSPGRLLLLDEPTAGLDAAMRARALALIREAASGWEKVLVHVSHSPAEVAAVTDHVVAINRGRVVGEGPPMDVLAAGSVLALWREEGFENTFEGISEGETVRAGESRWHTGRSDLPAGVRVVIGLRASDVILARERPERLSARNVLQGRVTRVVGSSDLALVRVEIGGVPILAEVTAASVKNLRLEEGADVWGIVKATSLGVTRSR
jgi:molybdate transport system ATP-binding protein